MVRDLAGFLARMKLVAPGLEPVRVVPDYPGAGVFGAPVSLREGRRIVVGLAVPEPCRGTTVSLVDGEGVRIRGFAGVLRVFDSSEVGWVYRVRDGKAEVPWLARGTRVRLRVLGGGKEVAAGEWMVERGACRAVASTRHAVARFGLVRPAGGSVPAGERVRISVRGAERDAEVGRRGRVRLQLPVEGGDVRICWGTLSGGLRVGELDPSHSCELGVVRLGRPRLLASVVVHVPGAIDSDQVELEASASRGESLDVRRTAGAFTIRGASDRLGARIRLAARAGGCLPETWSLRADGARHERSLRPAGSIAVRVRLPGAVDPAWMTMDLRDGDGHRAQPDEVRRGKKGLRGHWAGLVPGGYALEVRSARPPRTLLSDRVAVRAGSANEVVEVDASARPWREVWLEFQPAERVAELYVAVPDGGEGALHVSRCGALEVVVSDGSPCLFFGPRVLGTSRALRSGTRTVVPLEPPSHVHAQREGVSWSMVCTDARFRLDRRIVLEQMMADGIVVAQRTTIGDLLHVGSGAVRQLFFPADYRTEVPRGRAVPDRLRAPHAAEIEVTVCR